MRHHFIAIAAILQVACASARGADAPESIHVHANNINAAVLLKVSADLVGRRVLLDPKLGERQVSISRKYANAEDYFAQVASLLQTTARRDEGTSRIGEHAVEPQVAAPVPRENNCPYRYPDLQTAIKAALPDRLRICQPLEFFPLSTLRVIGIIGQGSEFRAVVASPDGFAWSLKEGDYLGQDFGKVLRISKSGIELREIVQDENGEWNEKRSVLSVK